MSVIFGDFVFKITAPIENAIKNLKTWDKQTAKTIKQTDDFTKEQEKNLIIQKKAWSSFSKVSTGAILALNYAVLKYSPTIEAHISLWGLYFELFAMDVGERLAPAFEFLTDVIDFLWTKWEDMPESLKDTAAWGIGIAGVAASFITIKAAWVAIGGLGNVLSGGATSAAAINTSLLPFIGGVTITIAGIALAKGLGVDNFGAALIGFVGLGATLLGAGLGITIPLVIAATVAAVAEEKISDTLEDITEKHKEETGMLGEFGIVDVAEDILVANREIRMQDIKDQKNYENIMKNVKDDSNEYTINGIMNAAEKQKTIWQKLKDSLKDTTKSSNSERIEIEKVFFNKIENMIKIEKSQEEKIIDSHYKKLEEMSTVNSKITVDIAQDMMDNVNDVITDGTSNVIKSGEDYATNFGQGLENKKGWIKNTWDNILDKLGFDNWENDKMAQKWGSDMVEYFGKGVQERSPTSITQNINNSLSINSSSMGGDGIDPYQLANLTGNLLNKQIGNLKGLGSQYY